jgi:hypothetical protein
VVTLREPFLQILPTNHVDAWIGPGGALTQSSDANAAGYYQGTGTQAEYEAGTGSTLSDRDSQNLSTIYRRIWKKP